MRAAITGVGVVTSIGIGATDFVDSLRRGRQNLSKFSGVPVPRGKASVGLIDEPMFDFPDRALRMSKLALSEALNQSKFQWDDGRDVALILSTVTSDGRALEELYSEFIKDGEPNERVKQALQLFSNGTLLNSLGNYFGWYGPRMVVSNACASGNIALGMALDMLRLGRCRAAVVPGVELVKLSTVWGAERSGFVGRMLRPFHSKRDGSILGEGAGAIIVEHPDDVQEERVLGWIEGFGCAVDLGAAAITLLDDGSGLRRGMSLALADANREPTEIEYINAHAPGTPLIDRLECQAVSDLFGSHARNISVNSTKSLTTHMGAASGVVEVIGTLLQMQHGFLHPHAGLDEVDPLLAIEVIGDMAVERRVTRAISNACGGGGLSTSVVITAPLERPKPEPKTARTRKGEIIITGFGSVSSLGAGDASIFAHLRPSESDDAGPLQWFDIHRWYPRETNYSYMNRAAQLGAAAGAIAIADAAFDGAYASDRIAVISGTLLGGAPQASAVICQELMKDPNIITPNMALDHGVHLSAALVRRYFGYNGVTYTLTGSCVAGLQAVLVARDLLTTGRADAAVVLGHDALDDPLRHAAPWLDGCLPSNQMGEGAGAIVLEWSDRVKNRSGNGQAQLGASVMMAGRIGDDDSRQRIVHKLGASLGEADWNVVYLVGPNELELADMARLLPEQSGRTASIKRLQPFTGYCMAADAMFAIAAATTCRERALILAGEPDGSVAALCISPN
jgi:3-oxoacyl-[acyl-carrier-protein] synthase II